MYFSLISILHYYFFSILSNIKKVLIDININLLMYDRIFKNRFKKQRKLKILSFKPTIIMKFKVLLKRY